MNKFIKSVGEKDILLTKPDIVAFLLVGSDGDLLLASCDYINNIRPALAAMLDKLQKSDELAVPYVRNSFFYIISAATVADVYNQEQKSVIGSTLVHPAFIRHRLVGTVGSLCDLTDELACGKIQEEVYQIYAEDTEDA